MSNKITQEGRNSLINELSDLLQEQKEAVKRLITARAYGDLKENAEYQEAKDSLKKIEQNINQLQTALENCIVMPKSSDSIIGFGSTVIIEDINTKEKKTYTIVGEFESDVMQGLLSETTPLAQQMYGKKVNSIFELLTSRGTKTFKILEIKIT